MLKRWYAVGGPQGFAVFRQHHLGHALQLGGWHQIRLAPVEQVRGKQLEAGHHSQRLAVRALYVLQQSLQLALNT